MSTLVVVPHPDDESLSTGGLIARQARRARVEVVAVTAGEAAPLDISGLADVRRREQAAAVSELGAGIVVHHLGLPDGRVAASEDLLADAVLDLMDGFALVVAPWTSDHHTDHEACGRATTVAVGRATTPPQLMYGLFWAWHRPETHLPHLRHLALDPAECRAKERAIRRHHTQLSSDHGGPIVSDADLVPALWSHEHYVEHAGSRP
ncbi:MAG: PIG-L deacetylase family protein [Acidimicrobiales bacterium]